MSDGTQNNGSVPTGSPVTDPATIPAGQSAPQGINYEEAYKELESRFGHQGNELGEYRKFVESVTPLLEKLDGNPSLVNAIVSGKIDDSLVQSVLDGKITPTDAQAVTQASKEVAKSSEVVGMTPEQVTALVEQKASEIRKELEEKAQLSDFEQKTKAFIESTPDFVEYAEEIDSWLDEHNISDIEVAYYAVKGKLSTKNAAAAAEAAQVERARELAQNAAGGGTYATTAPDGTPLIDKLVGGPANPMF